MYKKKYHIFFLVLDQVGKGKKSLQFIFWCLCPVSRVLFISYSREATECQSLHSKWNPPAKLDSHLCSYASRVFHGHGRLPCFPENKPGSYINFDNKRHTSGGHCGIAWLPKHYLPIQYTALLGELDEPSSHTLVNPA